ncbi:MAG TPA: hypothetical protein VID93_09840 [Acidimicrobiales bacterium]
MAVRFPISLSPHLRWLFQVLGLGPARSTVTVDDGLLAALAPR